MTRSAGRCRARGGAGAREGLPAGAQVWPPSRCGRLAHGRGSPACGRGPLCVPQGSACSRGTQSLRASCEGEADSRTGRNILKRGLGSRPGRKTKSTAKLTTGPGTLLSEPRLTSSGAAGQRLKLAVVGPQRGLPGWSLSGRVPFRHPFLHPRGRVRGRGPGVVTRTWGPLSRDREPGPQRPPDTATEQGRARRGLARLFAAAPRAARPLGTKSSCSSVRASQSRLQVSVQIPNS